MRRNRRRSLMARGAWGLGLLLLHVLAWGAVVLYHPLEVEGPPAIGAGDLIGGSRIRIGVLP
jgi:hypothetical protein